MGWITSGGNNSIQYDSIKSHNGKPLGVNYINDKLKVRSGGSSLDTTEFELINVSAKSLNLYSLSIDDPEAPQKVDQALEKVLNEHSKIGSIINRLNFRVDELHISEEFVMDSRSRILDTNVVYESSLLTKEQLKQETSLSKLLKNQLKQQSTLNLLQEA